MAMALLAIATPAEATMPGTNGKIAFVRTDASGNSDIWVMNPDGSGQTNLTNHPTDDFDPAWSRDGSQLAFASDRDRTPQDQNSHIYVMDADGSNVRRLTFSGSLNRAPTWSPDGSQLAFQSSPLGDTVEIINADGSGRHAPGASGGRPAWSPDGEPIAWGTAGIGMVNPDGTGGTKLTSGSGDTEPDWAPDHQSLVFWRMPSALDTGIYTIRPGAGPEQRLPESSFGDARPVWSPDGTKLAIDNPDGAPGANREIVVMNPDGTGRTAVTAGPGDDTSPAWQAVDSPPAIRGYPRPISATPLRLSLVPAYYRCSAPNREHGPPLAFPSCSPPEQISPSATIGTSDANGSSARSIGRLRFGVQPGNPMTPEDEADVKLSMQISDLRCREQHRGCAGAALSDYVAELRTIVPIRITDKYNGYTLRREATMQDTTLAFKVPCAATSDDLVGATCSLETTFDALAPGVVPEKRRSIWALGTIRVDDAGQDGFADSLDDNFPFATPGIFVP
jgi:TolB protein